MDVRIARYDECPEPSYCIGFSVSLKGDPTKSIYLDAFVAKDKVKEGSTQEEVARQAWAAVKDSAEAFVKEQERQATSIVGKAFDV